MTPTNIQINTMEQNDLNSRYSAKSIIRYSSMYGNEFKIVAEVQPELVDYYFSLIPKELNAQRQAYKPHITIVRTKRESPTSLEKWYNWEGSEVNFWYCGVIERDETYFWLKVYCPSFCDIREEVGLPRYRNGFVNFHLTIGNIKQEQRNTSLIVVDEPKILGPCPSQSSQADLNTLVAEAMVREEKKWEIQQIEFQVSEDRKLKEQLSRNFPIFGQHPHQTLTGVSVCY